MKITVFMKAWLRGGLIAEAILIVGYITLLSMRGDVSILPMIIFFFGENPFGLLMTLWFIFLYFILGATIGWLIGWLTRKIRK